MAYELTFTVHPVGASTCDICSNRVGYGFETTARGVPIFFHCVTCVYETYGVEDIDQALADRQQLLARIEAERQAEQLEEEAYRDNVMRVWIESETEALAC